MEAISGSQVNLRPTVQRKLNQTKPNQLKPYKPNKNQPNQTKTNQTKLDLTKYLREFVMSKSAAQLLYAPVLVFKLYYYCIIVDRLFLAKIPHPILTLNLGIKYGKYLTMLCPPQTNELFSSK